MNIAFDPEFDTELSLSLSKEKRENSLNKTPSGDASLSSVLSTGQLDDLI